MNEHEKAEAAAIEEQYPGWEAWVNLNGQWRARLKHSVPTFMVFGDYPADIKAQIAARIRDHP